MALTLTGGLVVASGSQQPQVDTLGNLAICVARSFNAENQPAMLELAKAGIQKGVVWANLHHRFRFGSKQAADANLVAGTNTVSLAADFFAVHSVQLVNTDGYESGALEYVDWAQFNQLEPEQTSTGTPQYWTAYNAFDNNELLVYPTPDAGAATAYDVRVSYYERITQPTSDSDIIDAPQELGYVLCTYGEYYVAYARDRENVAAWASKKREAERALARFVNSTEEEPGGNERFRMQWDNHPRSTTYDPLR